MKANKQANKAIELERAAQVQVRETAYHCIQLHADEHKGQEWSQAVGLYETACYMLRLIVPLSSADEYIRNTYQLPK